jgi:hypothetical protein
MNKNELKKKIETDLPGFTGTENWYRHSIGNVLYTDGVKYLADNAGCYWLIDVISSYQLLKEIKGISFQIWELKVNEDQSAVVTMKEDSGCPDVVKQKIPYTDFPLDEMKFYFTDNVLMLVSEY